MEFKLILALFILGCLDFEKIIIKTLEIKMDQYIKR